jgi:hypothetical protein
MVQKPACWVYGPNKLVKKEELTTNPMIKVDEKLVRLGKSFDFPSYGWDNEYGQVNCRLVRFDRLIDGKKIKIIIRIFIQNEKSEQFRGIQV